MNLTIILRTHDGNNVHEPERLRYCGESKSKVMLKCVKSLLASVSTLRNICYNVVWIDDHSKESSLSEIKSYFYDYNITYELVNLEKFGNNASMVKQLEIAKQSTSDLVYLVEDDYLHCKSAVPEMVDSYIEFKNNLDSEVAIHPFDDPDNYKPNFIELTRIVLGQNRHWRLNCYSTFTFMCNPDIIRENWDSFYKMAYLYMTPFGNAYNIHEGTTINKIWRENVYLFTPIPSVALHMQFDEQKDKYINWKKWWEEN